MRRFALASLLAHGLVAGAFLVRLEPGPPPATEWAKVELIQQDTPTVGDGAQVSGTGQANAPEAAPPPVPLSPPPTPPIPPSLADLPPVPMPADTPSEQPAPTPLPPPTRTDAAGEARPLPPPAPPQPSPPKQARAQPPIPRSPPPTPPKQAPIGDTSDAPAIRLGEGDTVGTALVTGDNIIPAQPDSSIHNPQPPYPDDAARRGEAGTVILIAHVSPDGRATSVDVQETSGYQRLDQAAHDAVVRWRFRPAQQNGLPIASDMPVRVRFVLKE